MTMDQNAQAFFVYMTAGNLTDARRLARELVERRVAACCNLLPAMVSVYQWQGEVNEDEEVGIIAKTTPARFEDLKAAVREVHNYECPCIVALPVVEGHQPFIDWIAQECQPL
jgi:periplasmic divalent cation tolerance protein